MKMLITIILLTSLGILSEKQAPKTNPKNPVVWLAYGSGYAEYQLIFSGPSFWLEKTGRCSLYQSGANPYSCN
jgi:hypothetical protein